jgi:delta 1-pyrroline-5-carboxylate dehydrogenase
MSTICMPYSQIFEAIHEPVDLALRMLREAVPAACRTPEPQAVAALMEVARLPLPIAERTQPLALRISRLEPGQSAVPLERLVVERALSINTAAAGGNVSLMTLG